jgi:thiamine pyrophosphate-dependent acetolactate synthase large subunit-like protein
MKKLPADIIAEFIQKEKITNVFDVTGGMIAYIEDSISRHPGIAVFPRKAMPVLAKILA